jgi:uncharacterized membrane protein
LVWSPVLRVLGVSALPFLELRVGIPVGIAAGMEPLAAISWGILGNLIQVPLSVLLLLGLRRLSARFGLVSRFSAYLDAVAERNHEKAKRYGWLGVTLLVGIPIPGTGLWTGAALSAIMRLPLRTTLMALSLGVVMAGLLVGALSTGYIHIFD